MLNCFFVSEKRFWNFTFDEMSEYDTPAIIDYVLNVTGKCEPSVLALLIKLINGCAFGTSCS